MEEFRIKFAKNFLTKEQIKEREKFVNELSLTSEIEFNNKNIKTIGQLKKVVKTFEILDSLINELSEDDYTCIYRWLENNKK
jgi:hypothetical protein